MMFNNYKDPNIEQKNEVQFDNQLNSSSINDLSINGVKKDSELSSIPSKNYCIHCDHPGHFYGLNYSEVLPIGNGSFGVVYKANITVFDGPISFTNIEKDFLSAPLTIYENIDSTTANSPSFKENESLIPAIGNNELVAIKKVLQDKRFKNRELLIMRKLNHINIVKLKYYFLTQNDKDELYLSLIIGFMPETIYTSMKSFVKKKQTYPVFYIKLFSFQLFRALMFIHSMGICHRDIKPQNLLVDFESGILKLCDFGSAKVLIKDESNVSYICSRFYRAPELIFGCSNYEVSIDIWSTGCVISELVLGNPLFPGQSGVDQLVEIIKVLGTPTKEHIRKMNPHYSEFRFPNVQTSSWSKVFKNLVPESLIDLISNIIIYSPDKRLTSFSALFHPFYYELFTTKVLPNGIPIPDLTNFTDYELSIHPDLANLVKTCDSKN